MGSSCSASTSHDGRSRRASGSTPTAVRYGFDGQQIPTLTNLEYRLLLLLYGRMGKICTKYEVVEAVWGEEYIDEVDDARIEKLVSRLRLEDRARSRQSHATCKRSAAAGTSWSKAKPTPVEASRCTCQH